MSINEKYNEILNKFFSKEEPSLFFLEKGKPIIKEREIPVPTEKILDPLTKSEILRSPIKTEIPDSFFFLENREFEAATCYLNQEVTPDEKGKELLNDKPTEMLETMLHQLIEDGGLYSLDANRGPIITVREIPDPNPPVKILDPLTKSEILRTPIKTEIPDSFFLLATGEPIIQKEKVKTK